MKIYSVCKTGKLSLLLTGTVAAVVMLQAASAQAAFSLGAFDTYGLLVNNGTKNGDINTFPVNANIGIGDVTGSVNLHNGEINGKVDCKLDATSDVSGRTITGTQPVSLGGTPPGGSPASVNSNVGTVQSAITAALNLSSTYGAESGLGTAVSITTGSRTINANDGYLDGSGVRIFTSSTFAIGNGNTLTINGTASQFVVIDVTDTSPNLDGALTLMGGITPDQVLINFIGNSGTLQGAANKATLMGTFLVPNLRVQLNSLTIEGHLFGGATGQDFQFVSNARINQPPLAPVPEPSTVVAGALLLIPFGANALRFLRRSR